MTAALLLLAACDGQPVAPPPPPASESNAAASRKAATASALSVTPSSVTLEVGETVQLVVSDGSGKVVSAQWRSSDSGVARVSSSGLVTAGGQGSATIEASVRGGKATGTADVTVTASPPAEDPTSQDPPDEDPPVEEPPVQEPTTSSSGIWISPQELAAIPASGTAWDNTKKAADTDLRGGALTVRDNHNVRVMAAALVAARLNDDGYRRRVRDALGDVMAAPVDDYDALAALRRLGTYAIAADLIGLDAFDSSTGSAFRNWLHTMVRYPFKGGGGSGSVIDYHERRPNNFGTHAGASRMAVAAYLGDDEDFKRAVRVFRGWLGDRSAYAGFSWGDLDWQCDSERPVGINPKGCTRSGHSIDGVLPDDQRRGGGFTWPPPKENYVYEALQGALAMAVIAHRRGYPAFEWSDRALLRAFHWLHEQAGYPAEGDDTWQPHVVNRYLGTAFPAPIPSKPGKNVGWTDWTHR